MRLAQVLLKLEVFTLPGTVSLFASTGYPAALAYPVSALELLGARALLLGVYARQASLALLPIMIGAALVHVLDDWAFSSPNGSLQYSVFLCAASPTLWLLGDGAFVLRRDSLPEAEQSHRAQGSAAGAAASRACSPASSNTGTPSSCALSSLEPASSPATT